MGLQPDSHSFSKQCAKLFFVSVLVLIPDRVADGHGPEPANARPLRRHAYRVTRRNGVDAFVRRAVWESTKHQESGHVLLVKLRDDRHFHKRLQTTGPLNFYVSYVIVKGTHPSE